MTLDLPQDIFIRQSRLKRSTVSTTLTILLYTARLEYEVFLWGRLQQSLVPCVVVTILTSLSMMTIMRQWRSPRGSQYTPSQFWFPIPSSWIVVGNRTTWKRVLLIHLWSTFDIRLHLCFFTSLFYFWLFVYVLQTLYPLFPADYCSRKRHQRIGDRSDCVRPTTLTKMITKMLPTRVSHFRSVHYSVTDNHSAAKSSNTDNSALHILKAYNQRPKSTCHRSNSQIQERESKMQPVS